MSVRTQLPKRCGTILLAWAAGLDESRANPAGGQAVDAESDGLGITAASLFRLAGLRPPLCFFSSSFVPSFLSFFLLPSFLPPLFVSRSNTSGLWRCQRRAQEAGRQQAGGQTDGQTDGLTDGLADGLADGLTD